MKLRNKKTGERGILALNNSEGKIEIVVLEPDMPLCGNSVLARYDSLSELNADWEDYEPKDPLIKDEKIRKAVRAWADINCFKYLKSRTFVGGTRFSFGIFDIDFSDNFIYLDEDKKYTIAELCGEEE